MKTPARAFQKDWMGGNASGWALGLENFYEAYHPWHVAMGTGLSIAGLCLNPLLAFVLLQREMRSAVNQFLAAIAVCQALLCLSNLAYLVQFDIRPEDPTCWPLRFSRSAALLALIHADLSVFLRAAALWLAAVMAGFRVVCLARPTHPTGSAAPLILPTLVLCLITSIPLFALNSLRTAPLRNNATLPGCPTDFTVYYVDFPDVAHARNDLLIRVGHWLNGLIFKLAPSLLLVAFLARLLRFLCRFKTYRSLLRGETSGPAPLTVTPSTCCLTVILVLTFLLELPVVSASLYAAVTTRQGVYQNLGDVFDDIALLSGLVTFPLYCATSTDFRRHFRRLFLPPPCRESTLSPSSHPPRIVLHTPA